MACCIVLFEVYSFDGFGDVLPVAVNKRFNCPCGKYVKSAYDRIEIKVPKGQKAVIQSFAEGEGKSLNSFACEAIIEKMERDASRTEGGKK